ncbi:bifunctional precorrin-2 dehydrogenase/sirohydrochlorin ferrochelatase [Chloroflexota bacterium]
MRTGRSNTFYYPISLNLSGKKCVVVGGGVVALRKVRGLLEHGANVEVISPSVCSEISALAEAGEIGVKAKRYEHGDLDDAFLVIVATAESDTNREVASEARRRKVLVNVVDDPEQSDFNVPSIVRQRDLIIAISTGGKSPALARKIRTRLEKIFGEEYASLTDLINEVRSELKQGQITVGGDEWQEALELDLLLELLRNGQRDRAKTTLLNNLKAVARKKS